MNKKLRSILIAIAAIAIIIGLYIAYYFSTKIPNSPNEALGNTAGNLVSDGLFCESDGIIYFSNPYDLGRLYSMNSDCSNIQLVSSDCVSNINVYGDYIYYARNNSATAPVPVQFFAVRSMP